MRIVELKLSHFVKIAGARQIAKKDKNDAEKFVKGGQPL